MTTRNLLACAISAAIATAACAADNGETLRGKAAGGADLYRAEIGEQRGIAAAVGQAAVLAYQQAFAVGADYGNGGGRMYVYRPAATGAGGVEQGVAHVFFLWQGSLKTAAAWQTGVVCAFRLPCGRTV